MKHANAISRSTQVSAGRRSIRWSVVLCVLAAARAGSPCSGVGPPGAAVVFGDQTNIVIWDEENHVEHFIRNANFRSGAANFGFIAPTPSKPELSEASNQAFYTLASLSPFLSSGFAFGGGGGLSLETKVEDVQVIQQADVSGYQATTLWSKSAAAINRWMNDNGYVSTPEVEKWADRYTSRGWYLTAFKVIDKKKLAASTGAIRMSFETDKPYNPFYVPSSNIPPNGGGTLRVYFVSVGNYEAHIGPNGDTWQTPQWTSNIPETSADQLAQQVNLNTDEIPKKSQVEAFVDNNFPRPAPEDIYFSKPIPAPPPPPPAPKPKRQTPPYAESLFFASPLLFAGFLRRRWSA